MNEHETSIEIRNQDVDDLIFEQTELCVSQR